MFPLLPNLQEPEYPLQFADPAAQTGGGGVSGRDRLLRADLPASEPQAGSWEPWPQTGAQRGWHQRQVEFLTLSLQKSHKVGRRKTLKEILKQSLRRVTSQGFPKSFFIMMIQPGMFLNYETLRLMLDECQQLQLWRTSSGTFSGAGVGLATSGAHPTEPQGGTFTPVLTLRVSLSISVHMASSPERHGCELRGSTSTRVCSEIRSSANVSS